MDTTTQTPPVASSALLGWLRGKLAAAEQALRCREDMATAKPLSAEEWEKLLKMPGVRITKGIKMSKAAIKEMHEMPRRHKRIAVQCRREVEMFRAAIAALEPAQPMQAVPDVESDIDPNVTDQQAAKVFHAFLKRRHHSKPNAQSQATKPAPDGSR